MNQQPITIRMLDEEAWWGGKVADGIHMPFTSQTDLALTDLSIELDGNQGCPLLISNKGRFIWSEEPFSFSFKEGILQINSKNGKIIFEEGKGTLSEVYQYVSQQYFPASGTYPDELMFTAPQYNLWIELLYEPTQEKVLQYAETLLQKGMPPGVLMIDDNWHEPYGTWQFHPGRFPDPKGMMDKLHALGFKVMLWVCPFVSPDSMTFRSLHEKGFLIKDHSGKVAVRQWWNGYSAVLDCTNPEAAQWFKEQLNDLQNKYGVDGFKFDAGDLYAYEETDQSYLPSTKNAHCEAWAQIGLAYTLNEYRICWKLAGQPIVQRLKDKLHTWDHNGLSSLIPSTLAQSLMGYAFVCPDMIGGGEYMHFSSHAESLDQELFVRYAQCSALLPMMQFSAAPWRVLDERHSALCVEAAQLHLEFANEIMHWVRHAAKTGEPVVRHLAYAFNGEGLENINDQFLLGDRVLVAPVLEKGATSRHILFPSGSWLGDDDSIIQGPCHIEVHAPLERLPRYRKL